MNKLFLAAASVIVFAANAILCRLALIGTQMDPETFTIIRVTSAAFALWLFMLFKGHSSLKAGQWRAGFSLFVYMIGFSLAFVSLSTAVGTLVLTVAIQASMLCIALWQKESVGVQKVLGVGIGVIGISVLFPQINLIPFLSLAEATPMQGFESPSVLHVGFMLCAGIGWGFYSLYGRKKQNPALNTAGNFIRCLPFTAVLLFFAEPAPWEGVVYALLSGAVASAFGYILWYAFLEKATMSTAAVTQLCVPLVAMFGGLLLVGESITARHIISTVITLSGIALAVLIKPSPK